VLSNLQLIHVLSRHENVLHVSCVGCTSPFIIYVHCAFHIKNKNISENISFWELDGQVTLILSSISSERKEEGQTQSLCKVRDSICIMLMRMFVECTTKKIVAYYTPLTSTVRIMQETSTSQNTFYSSFYWTQVTPNKCKQSYTWQQ